MNDQQDARNYSLDAKQAQADKIWGLPWDYQS